VRALAHRRDKQVVTTVHTALRLTATLSAAGLEQDKAFINTFHHLIATTSQQLLQTNFKAKHALAYSDPHCKHLRCCTHLLMY